MFTFILFILIVVLFIKVSNVNDRIDELTRRISQTTPTRQGYTQNTPIIKEEEKPFNPQNTEQEKREEQILSPQEKLENFLEPLIETKTETVQTKAEKINQTPKEEPTFKEYTNKKREAENAPFSTLSTNSILEEQTKEEAPSAVQFTAAKLFSWIAAIAFILAVIFGLVYVVQNEIISKQMITVFAGMVGLGLLGAGLYIKDEKLKTTVGTLCASGITTFFIATYCAFSFYNMINLPVAFVLMALTSFASFFISVKKDVQFISFLGMVAAFITPLLLSNGNDNYIFFFTYIAFINGAAIAVSLKKGWHSLLTTSFVFTFLCQLAWLAKDFNPQRANIFQIIFTIYSIALTCTYLRLKNTLPLFVKYVFSTFIIAGAIMVLPLMAIFSTLEPSSFILINLLILVTVSNALVLVLYYGEPTIFKVPAYIMGIVFLLSLFAWSHTIYATQTGGLLLLFAILGASLANSLVINSKTGESFSTVINLIALFLVFLMLMETNFKLENLSLVHNGTIIFNLALLAIAYKFKDKFTNALKTSLGSYIMASLLFSLLFTIQASTQINFIVILVNVFIVNLSLLFLTFKEGNAYKLPLKFASIGVFIVLYLMLSVKAALMPFAFSAYLLLGTLNLFTFLHLAKKEEQNFALIFAAVWFLAMFNTTNMYYIWFAAGILNLVCLSLARVFKKPSLILIAALGSSLLFARAHDIYAVIIACIFFILFFAFPFLCKKDFKEDSCPQWVASVYMGLVAWFITIGYETFASSTDKGLITLPFAALFLLNSGVLYRETQNNKYKTPFVIVSLTSIFFITAAISLLFANQMLTLALAAEGAALIVFNKKVPTNWNPKIGFVLLVIAFIRLIFIGEFSSGYTVDSKIFNWYMLVYSLSAAAMFVSAKYWVAEEKDNNTIKNILNIAGAVLLFFLVNIEIANYFSTSGEILKFNFFGDFASTITYTIVWTLYGAITCLIAFYNKHKTVLKIGIVIMILSIIKLFLFDLWSLGILYRIIGLFAMAGILFGISLIFQKFKDRLKE
jgi:Predicted membrane protein (DUF2339).